ncbi:transcriptional repressor DicA [Roseovarius albus]|uniref:Transcriptional repressor DicA n=1 Tax=Roseovarius albus TaxID=1247867 RepID=A0A1X7A0W4_9RHOB|nr:helix-turn-helix domain-containing protein [Roseovarius albus]SLN66863.1 transcriptional repressor DicA [Roseovarius albus]
MGAEVTQDWFDPETTTYGDRIAGAREQAGMSQDDFAERLGVKLETLKAWEEDLSEPRGNKLPRMAGLLNVSLAWLLVGEGDGPETPAAELAQGAVELIAEFEAIRSQVTAAAERLERLEQNLRSLLKGADLG